MPAFLVLQEGHAFAFHRAGQHRDGPAGLAGARVRVIDLGEVMAVDGDRIDAERAHPRRVRAQIPLELRRPALTEPVDIEDRGEIREPLMTGAIEGLPDGAFGAFTVSDEHPYVVRRVENAFAGERDADSYREALPE